MTISGDAQRRAKAISGAITVRSTSDGLPAFYGLWRDSSRRRMMRKLGDAWIESLPPVRNPFVDDDERPDAPEPGSRGSESWRYAWRERKGRAPDGFLAARKTGSALDDAILAREVQIDGQAIEEVRRSASPGGDILRFEDAADAWLSHRVAVGGIKRSTRINYEAMLRRTDAPAAKQGRAHRALVMRAFGGRPIESIAEREIKAFLRKLDDDPKLSARSINAHRQLLSSVFAFSIREGWITANPVERTEKRREADPAPIVTYAPEEVRAIARVLEAGGHRDATKLKLSPGEIEVRKIEDQTDAALVITAAFVGLRMGELLGLRWGDVGFTSSRINVQRAFVAGEETSPKSRKSRSVPMSKPVAQVLAKLSQRPRWTSPADLVFPSRTGEHQDQSALRRRYKRARDLARRSNPDMPALKLHELRHTFGTLAASGFDLVNVQFMMGHADSRTTARYLHARPADDDAARLSSIFGSDDVGDDTATPARSDAR